MTSHDSFTIGRRRVLGHAAAALGTAFLGGCAFPFPRDPVPICPQSPEVSFPKGSLTIDAHCHVFNGTDLQIREFLSRVAVKQRGALGAGARLLGSVLQALAWSFAPDGEAELAELRDIAQALQACSDGKAGERLASLRQNGYRRGREQLQAAARSSEEFRVLQARSVAGAAPSGLDADSAAKLDALRLIESLPEDVDAYHASKGARALSARSVGSRSAQGMIDFVLQNFQYRYVSVHDYLRTYNQPGTRVVDLLLPSMVDFDWWLAKGDATPTPLRTQVEVMQQIAIVTGGRVHGFVPFDPLRQVAFELGLRTDDSFGLVTEAVEQHGCVGVKLYPPMGFAALGNAALKAADGGNFWARDWLPSWADRPDLGSRLDQAMSRILTWCQANDVPVMAHTNLSNGVTPEFEALAGSPYWANALQAFPKLRVSFGHFGDTAPVEDGLARGRAFAALMNDGDARPGAFAYADAGYFVEVMAHEPALLANLRQLYDETAPKGGAALANRFMYGTDWEMTLTEGSVAGYLEDFVTLFDGMQTRPAMQARGLTDLSSKFFGGNAVAWAGLRRGEATRKRLDGFYALHRVAKPDWARKVDAL